MMRILWDYIKHLYMAVLVIIVSLAGYSYLTGKSVIQSFEEQYDYTVTAYGFTPSTEYWNPETKTIVTEEGTITLKHGEVTDGFVFVDEINESRNLMVIFEFKSLKDDTRPYSLLKDNFILYQNGKELSDGGVTNENESRDYQGVMNAAVSFYDKGESTLAARAIVYEPNGGPVSIVINGTEYKLTDIIDVYEQETATKLRESGQLTSFPIGQQEVLDGED